MLALKSYVFVLVAYCLTLLHASVPHQHPGIRTGHAVVQATKAADNSLSGLLQSAFATDLGCGHLEAFAKSDANADFALALPFISPGFLLAQYSLLDFNQSTPEFPDHYIGNLQVRILLFSSRQFRAPPVVA